MTPVIQEKINDIATVKDDIRVEIVGKGASLPLNSPFVDYPAAARTIQGAGPVYKEPVIHGVNYYDYKGDVLYTYTVDEFLALGQHPAQVGTETLKGDGWNWSLEDAQDFIRNKFDLLNIGGQYITKDGGSRIYLDIPEELAGETLFFQLAFNIFTKSGEETYGFFIDWGDGETTTKYVDYSSSNYTSYFENHVYTAPGKYVITCWPNNDYTYYAFGNPGVATSTINAYGATSDGNNYSEPGFRDSRQWIKAVECGANFLFQNSSFIYYGIGCEYVSIPHLVKPTETYSTTSIITNRFSYARSLKAVIYPEGLTAPTANTTQAICAYCNSARVVSLPKSYTPKMDAGSWMRECLSLDSIVLPDEMIPNQATTVGTHTYIAAGCTNMKRAYMGGSVPGTKLQFANYSFYQDFSLKEVAIPSGYIRTGQDVCGYCYGLETIDLPASISYINNYAFRDCYNLKNIIIRRTTVPSLQSNYPFNNVNYANIWVPASAYSAYAAATGSWASHHFQLRKIGVEYGFGEMTNQYINSSNAIVDVDRDSSHWNAQWCLSGFIPVTGGHALQCSNGMRADGAGRLGIYSAAGQILSSAALTTAGTAVTLPATAAYVRLSCSMNHENACCVFDNTDHKLLYPIEGAPKYMIFEDLEYYYGSGEDGPDQDIFSDILQWLNAINPNEYDEIVNNMQMDESFPAYMELLADEYSGAFQITPNSRTNQYSGCKIYQSWGNTMEIDGKTYYIWEVIRTVSNGQYDTETFPYGYKYVLTDTYNIDELNNKFSYLKYAKTNGTAYTNRNPNYQDDYPVRYALRNDDSIMYTQIDPSSRILQSELIVAKEGVYTWNPWYINPNDEN